MNTIDRLFFTEIASEIESPNYVSTEHLAVVSNAIQEIESICNISGWMLPGRIVALLRSYANEAKSQRLTAIEYSHFSDSLNSIGNKPAPNLEQRHETLRKSYDSMNEEMRKKIAEMEGELKKLSR
jgi:hypothetical protein